MLSVSDAMEAAAAIADCINEGGLSHPKEPYSPDVEMEVVGVQCWLDVNGFQ